MTPVLLMESVSKSYPSPGGPVTVLSRVNLEIQAGEFVIVTGPSGSGKTTLLHLAALLDQPTSGKIVFDGRDVSALNDAALRDLRKETIGLVFQQFHLLSRRTALENVMFRFRYLPIKPEQQRAASERALERVGLLPLASRPVRLLSSGEMQRVAIARAVAWPPRLLVADEPTGNLDARSTESIMDLFGELHRAGTTILLVTHNPAWIGRATRHLRVHQGELLS